MEFNKEKIMSPEEKKKKSIANQIRNVRTDLKMTQVEFAEDLGTSKQAINNYERGKNFPSFKFLENLYYVHGISNADLLEQYYAEVSNEQV